MRRNRPPCENFQRSRSRQASAKRTAIVATTEKGCSRSSRRLRARRERRTRSSKRLAIGGIGSPAHARTPSSVGDVGGQQQEESDLAMADKTTKELDEDEANMQMALADRSSRSARAKFCKPAAAAATTVGKSVRSGAKKRPAAAPAANPLKRPAAAGRSKRPDAPLGPQGSPPTWYREAKVTISETKGCYRVSLDCSLSNPPDRKIMWGADTPAQRRNAWTAVLDMIDAARDGARASE